MNKRFLLLASMAFILNACAGSETQSGDNAGNTNDTGNTNVTKPLCTNGSVQCNKAGVPELCTDGNWKTQTPCPSTQKCLAGKCQDQNVSECKNGARMCSDYGVPQLCVNEKWTNESECSSDKRCVDGYCISSQVAECGKNEKRCNAVGVPEKCQDGFWVKQVSCTENQKCLKGDCVLNAVPECNDGKRQCSVDGLPQICQKQKWVSLSACKSNEECHKKSGECEVISTCNNNECEEMTADKYMGNICVEGYYGTKCGCKNDNDCHDGYNCITSTQMCEKSKPHDSDDKDDPGSSGSGSTTNNTNENEHGICIGHAGSTTCEDNYVVSCSPDSAEIGREDCSQNVGGAYKGDRCVTDKTGAASCGCNKNADCKSSEYECNRSSHTCEKVKCSADKCAKKSGSQYTGNVCVDSYIEGTEDCGCLNDSNCKDGYKCNQIVMRCLAADPEAPKTLCSDKANGSSVCQNDAIVYCEYGRESTRVNCSEMSNGVYGKRCIDEFVMCGCNSDSDCLSNNYRCDENHLCVKRQCSETECRKKTGNSYMGNICIEDFVSNDGDKVCGCLSDEDCKTGFVCHPAMGFCYVSKPAENNNGICDGINDSSICSGDDVVYCDYGQETYRVSCTASDDNTMGNTCVSDLGYCGCNKDSDCQLGYQCNKNIHSCEPKQCSAAECQATKESDYQGSACVDGWTAGSKMCGCNTDLDCNSGYRCNGIMMACTKTEVVTEKENICENKQDSMVCDGDYLVYCNYGIETDRQACSSMSGNMYMGDICLADYDVCGCNSSEDCNSGYECTDAVCVRVPCSESACKNAPSNSYLGNVCVEGYSEGELICGCRGNADCNAGYECNTFMMACTQVEGSSGICEGKPDDSAVCDGNTVAYCSNNRVTSRYNCESDNTTTSDTFWGNTCVEEIQACGCNKARDCLLNNDSTSNYTCNLDHVCVEECSKYQCSKKISTSEYRGNTCIDAENGKTGEQRCGCRNNIDCYNQDVHGYVCDTETYSCVKTNCDWLECKSAFNSVYAGSTYYGDNCVKNGSGANLWGCGCLDNNDCKENYTCDQATMTCKKNVKSGICNSKNNEYVCDGDTSVYCVDGQVSGSTEQCNLVTSDLYTGSICYSKTGKCGCNQTEYECRSGYECVNHVCVKEAPNPCIGKKDVSLCDGNELVYCGNGEPIKRQNCSNDVTNGFQCMKDQASGNHYCGCETNIDCYIGFKCNLKHKCVSGMLELKSPESLDCPNLRKNTAITSCSNSSGKYILNYDNEVVAELYLNSKRNYNFNLSQTGKHYIKFTNLRPGAKASIVWEFESSTVYNKIENNQLKISDGKNSQVYKLTNSGQVLTQFNIDSSSTSLMIEHAGSGSDALVVRSIIIM